MSQSSLRSSGSNMAMHKTQTTVFIETSALIPMLDRENAHQKRIIAHLSSKQALASIDTVVLSEYLAGLSNATDKSNVAEHLSRQFRIYTFDAQTAIVCAEVFRVLMANGQIPKNQSNRQITKADIMIMASAIVSGASELLFNDGHFRSYKKFLPDPICGHKLPEFVCACELPPEIVQDNLGL